MRRPASHNAPRRALRRAPILALLISLLAPPHALSQLSPYADAVAARFPAPSVRYDVPVLAEGRDDFTGNDELADLLTQLSRAGGTGGTRIDRLELGRSQEGVAIQALRFSRSTGKPVVLLIGQQHGDEPAGAEALLVVARALAGSELGAVLDQIEVIVLPRANPDGAGWGRRVAANGFDINRDHLLLRTSESQALARLVREHRPVVVVDAHEHTVVGRYREKFNAVQRYDMLLQYAMAANLPPALGRASEEWFRQPMLAALAREGLRSEWYYTNSMAPQNLRLSMGGVQPDTGRNVNGLRHAVSLLLESRGVGIGRLHLARRMHSHVVAMRAVLHSAAAHAAELVALQRAADAEVAAAACRGSVVVSATTTPTRRELLMLDPVTGADKALQVDWDSALQLRTVLERPRPCGYWLAAGETVAVEKLRALGVSVRTLGAAVTLQAEAWQEQARGEMARPDVRGTAADGAQTIVRVQVGLAAREHRAEPGSHYVPLDQPYANLIIAALEPDTQNSYYANRLLGDLNAVLRVTARPEGF
ncbi:M14 family metallocarboxypeptidase [Aquabacterium sp.]|uniref:M14 family metallocarboxypeptidase n=1 Tax=Aquabacterium sp. TaxID=1872578 RepID=UPI002B6F0A23|nr:M14 family metallocarboxypeptidase [Aquabacterium sp.]HSW06384.1 M14 family metallocarboxypeptidase [Aquabacterium sp.]